MPAQMTIAELQKELAFRTGEACEEHTFGSCECYQPLLHFREQLLVVDIHTLQSNSWFRDQHRVECWVE